MISMTHPIFLGSLGIAVVGQMWECFAGKARKTLPHLPYHGDSQ